jgi:hypothetical protein
MILVFLFNIIAFQTLLLQIDKLHERWMYDGVMKGKKQASHDPMSRNY